LTANFAYLDATFGAGSLPAISPTALFPIGAPVALAPQSIDGNRLSRAPEWQIYLAADYEFFVDGLGEISLRADWKYQSEVFFLEVNQGNNTFREGPSNELGVRATLTLNDSLDISVFGRNITDNRYVTQVTQLGSFPNGALNDPVKWGIQAKFQF